MNGQLILKEWREKAAVPLFAVIFLAIFIVIARVSAQHGEALDILNGTILLVFLPMTAVLLGAGAFGGETKDGAWAYLFSRPVKKTTVWISKLVALAFYLAVILLVYGLVLSLVPGIRERIADFVIFGGGLGDLSFLAVSVVLSVSLFVIAFSLSILTDKQLQVIFLAGFVFAGFFIALAAAYQGVLSFRSQHVFLFPVAWALGIASIGAASLRAFCRADFSQPRAKAGSLLKSFGVLLAATAGLVLAASWVAGRFGGMRYIGVTDVQGGHAYIESSRGTFRYDAEKDEFRKLRRKKYASWGWSAGGGGKVVWIEASIVKTRGKRDLRQDLWIMDEDGRNRRPLLLASEIEARSFSGQRLWDCHLSPDGRRVFFLAVSFERNSRNTTCWSLNSDGSGLRSYRVQMPNADSVGFRGWSADGRHVILVITEKMKPEDKRWLKRRSRIFRLTLDAGAWRAFPEGAVGTHVFGLSPDGTKLGLLVSGTPDPEIPPDLLAVFDIETMAGRDLLRIPGVQLLRWNPDGERVAFLADQSARIGILSLTENRVLSEKALSARKQERMRGAMDWTAGGRKVVLSDLEGYRYVLRVFDGASLEDTTYRIPEADDVDHFLPLQVYGFSLGEKALLADTVNEQIWVFDLAAEKWKKLF